MFLPSKARMAPNPLDGAKAVLMFILLHCAVAKECTNVPTQLSSHTVRSKMETAAGAALRASLLHQRHEHLNPTEESAWMDLMPRKPATSPTNPALDDDQFDWLMLYRTMTQPASDATADVANGTGRSFLSEVSLHDVRLALDSEHGRAQQTNLEYLLMLDVDRLVWSFRRVAGIAAPPGEPYGGWESPKMELRGHFVGHYMSATAHMWASTHNEKVRAKMTSVVDALHECQRAIGSGYLSAFPPEFFDRFEAIEPVWAPYYTIHKIMAGLLDQYTLAGSSKALEMAVWMAEYFGERVKKVIQKYTIERHWTSLNEETGGMNDVLYRLYAITKDQKHLTLAHLFDKPCFLGLLAVQADSLSGFHTNTHIPVVVGAQMRYEFTGDPLYKDIAAFFMSTVNSSHAYTTGGTSDHEFWTDPMRMADALSTETEESCTTYNMLKVSRNLFRWTKATAYADYYERALTNGVLSIQRGTDPGVMIYMLPQVPGASKARTYHGWGTRFNSFWCCYGTGIESFSKLGDSIYFEDMTSNSLFIIQYIPSTFNWRNVGLVVTQVVPPLRSVDTSVNVQISISANESSSPRATTLFMRAPSWSPQGTKGSINGKDIHPANPGTFLLVSGNFGADDHIDLWHSIGLRTEPIKDDRPEYASLHAVLFGPYLLAGLTDGDWETKAGSNISDWIVPVPPSYNSQLLTLVQRSGKNATVLSNVNGTMAMEQWPEDGTDSAVHATFRVYTNEFPAGEARNVSSMMTGTNVIIEPIDMPGMAVSGGHGIVHMGGPGMLFRLAVPGLDGTPGSASFELESKPGCYLSAGSVACRKRNTTKDSMSFRQAATFLIAPALRRYHPISFAARGMSRNFLLEPLMSLKDESYTIYFDCQS